MITIQLFTRRRAILGVLCLLLLFLLGWHSTSLSVPSASKTGALHGGTNALIDDIYNSTLGVRTLQYFISVIKDKMANTT